MTKGPTRNSKAGNPKKKCPNCRNRKMYSRHSVGGVPQRGKERGPKDPDMRREATRGPPEVPKQDPSA